MTTYTIRYDRDDNGAYAADITADVLDARWRLGMTAPYDSVAQIATAEITVRNRDRRYSPEDPTSALQIGLALRITSDDGTTQRTHFIGAIAHVDPAPGDHGERTAVITAEGPLRALRQTRVRLDALRDVRADEVVAAVLAQVPLRARYLGGAFIVGLAGRAELGQTTRLPDSAALVPSTLQRGSSVFAYVGDTWDDGMWALRAIEDAVEAERGRFYVDRGGGLVLLGRFDLLETRPLAATFRDDMAGLRFSYGADVVSRVGVTLRPRRVSATNEGLWTLGQAQRVLAGRSQAFTARFRAPDGSRIGALSVQTPRPYADYTINSDPAGAGTDLTGSVELQLIGVSGSAAQLRLVNPGSVEAYLLPGAVVRGRAIYTAAPITVEASDPLSETFYGPHDLVLSLPVLTSITQAEDIARFELFRRAQPRGAVWQMTLSAGTAGGAGLALTLFERVRVEATQTGHSAAYLIVGEAHHVSEGGARHTVTWALEPVNAGGWWRVGSGKLGISTRLAY
jgi:hypothetical protein